MALERQRSYQARAIQILGQLLDARTISWSDIDQTPELQSLRSCDAYRRLAADHDS